MQASSIALDDSRAGSHRRQYARLGLAALAIVSVWNLFQYAIGAGLAIRFPYGLDYGEGIVWQQMQLLLSGDGYGTIEGFPAIVFHYPPLYHVAVGMLSAVTGMDQLAAGRLLSIGSTVVMSGFIAASVVALSSARTGRTPGWIGGLLAASIVLSTLPVQSWSYLMRVDMLSLAFGFAGFYFGLRSLTRPGAIHVAAVLFVAAVYTKQTTIAGPIAVFAVLLFLRPRTAWAGIATGLGLGLVALALMIWLTDGEFLHHILLYNINRFQWRGLLGIGAMFQTHLLYVIVALFSIYIWHGRLPSHYFNEAGWRGLRQRLLASSADAGYTMALLYLVLVTLMLPMALKSGASVNYFLEWGCIVGLFTGFVLVDAAAVAMGKPVAAKAEIVIAILPLILAVNASQLSGATRELLSGHLPPRQAMARLAELVKAAPAPVVSDDMVIVLRGEKPVIWEPAIFAELASKDMWDERPFLSKIEAREFAFFITQGKAGDRLYDSRYSPSVSRAIQTYYPAKHRLAGYYLHFPDGALPAYAASLR